MKGFKMAYRNPDWLAFSEKIKDRDGYRCLECGRTGNETTLQVHHKIYIAGQQPWQYALSDCITLCKGCHAEKHGLTEPRTGWILVGVNDLGGLYGTCERIGCGHEIRYEHEIYHPNWGYKIVGSSCVEYLTREDRAFAAEILKVFNKASKFVHGSIWHSGLTTSGKAFISTTYKHHLIRIYGKEGYYSFQIAIKEFGERWHNWRETIFVKGKTLMQTKEMAFIVLKGVMSESESERDILRNIYKELLK